MSTEPQLIGTEKPWGRVWTLDFGSETRRKIDALSINFGGTSSIHRHVHTFNEFFVIRGRLNLHLFRDGPKGPVAVTQLKPGQRHLVTPGAWHQFVAMTDCAIVETYWRPDRGPVVDDIERFG